MPRSVVKHRGLGTWARDLLNMGWRWQVGNGRDIRVWQDPWLSKPLSFKVDVSSQTDHRVNMVADLLNPDNSMWKTNLVREMFSREDVDLILSISVSITQKKDKKICTFPKMGRSHLNWPII